MDQAFPTACTRACLQSSKPEKDCSDGDHGEIVGGTLFVSGGDASKVLQPVDHALDDVALAVCLAVEVGLATLVGLGRDHRGDAALAQGLPDAPAAVSFVAGQLGWPQARPALADAADRAAVDQGGDRLAVMHLAAGQGERDRLAVALAAHVDRETAARAAQRLVPGAGFTTRLARPGGVLVRPCCPGSAVPSRPAPRRRPATPPARAATHPTAASGRTGSTPCPPGRSGAAGRAMARRC